jgi:periplasmic divalent cation tolerance protein
MSKFVELILTTSSWQEAQKIADHLLDERLVACVEFIEIRSNYWRHGNREAASEVKLIMETLLENFDKVEAVVRPLHSYDTFVLQMIKIDKLSKDAGIWLEEELQDD